MRWSLWSKPPETAGTAGLCEKCNSYGMVLLGGMQLLCWDHYCAEMKDQRDRHAHTQRAP